MPIATDLDDPLADYCPPHLQPTSGFRYRDYQDECCAAVESAWAQFRRLLIVLATGCGKTVIFTRLAHREVNRGGRVLILAHTEELIDQAADKLERSTGLRAAREKASDHATIYDRIVVAQVQTLCREARLQGWPPDHFTLIIVDEAHRTLAVSYLKILEHFAPARVLGVTATATRGDKKSLAAFYEHLPFQFGLLPAVHAGWLVRPKIHTIPLQIDIKGVSTSRTPNGADLDLSELSHRIAPFLHQIAKILVSRSADRGQGIIFLPSVETAAMMADSLNHYDPGSAAYVSGDCKDRAEKIAAFKSGRTRRLCNAMLLTEGFDHDRVDWVCPLRLTKIIGLYQQIVGRVLRPLNEIVPALNAAETAEERVSIIGKSAKSDAMVYDFLWLSDDPELNLVTAYDLVARNSAVAAQMKKSGAELPQDLIDLEAQADRDLLKSLEKAVDRNKKKKARVIDPLELAVTLKDEEIAHYEPSSRWEFQPPSPDQKALLAEEGIDAGKIATAGLAFKILQKAKARKEAGLCTFRQMNFFEKMGVEERRRNGINDVAFLSASDANRIQRAKFARWAKKKK